MSAAALRLTHVVESLERGGLERMVVDLARHQAAEGHAVQVLCLFRLGLLAAELAGAGIPVTSLDKRDGLDLAAIRALRAQVMAHAAHVVHTHNPVAHYYTAAALRGRVRMVNTRHGMGNRPFSVRREVIYRLSLRRTASVATVCESARRNFVRHRIIPARKAVVIPNGIRVDDFAPQAPAARAAALTRLGLPADGLYVGTVGRLNPVKDHAMLLRAFARLRGDFAGARLVLVGDGVTRAALEGLARELGLGEAVRFCGDRGDVRDLLPGFDVFALSSLSEGYSIALLEASACALPIVATDVGGNREIVADGVTGIVVPAANPDTFAAALARLAADPALRRRMGDAARSWARDHGTVAAMARRYLALYRNGAPGTDK
jgi:glycosyltransferase involved in cell wall biosynthesis